MKLPDDIVVMGSEPIPEWEPDHIREWYNQHHNEAGLAQAFAIASNKFWWVEDNVYDYEEGTQEYQEACRVTDAWENLMDALKQEIFAILESEEVVIPQKRQIAVLVPFMARNGYCDGNGWWIPAEEK